MSDGRQVILLTQYIGVIIIILVDSFGNKIECGEASDERFTINEIKKMYMTTTSNYDGRCNNMTINEKDLQIRIEEGNVRYNIFERLEKYVIEIDVLGLSRDEIDVWFDGESIIRIRTNPTGCEECSVESYDILKETFKQEKFRCKIFYPNIEKVNIYLNQGILTIDIFKLVKSTKLAIELK